jgi:hypothetical protein
MECAGAENNLQPRDGKKFPHFLIFCWEIVFRATADASGGGRAGGGGRETGGAVFSGAACEVGGGAVFHGALANTAETTAFMPAVLRTLTLAGPVTFQVR